MDFETLKIKEFVHWEIYLHENQHYPGRLYLWAKRKDALDFIEMTPEERKEFFEIASAVNKALAEIFQPDLMNYAALGNTARHLHIHFIPRYASPRVFDGITFKDSQWGANYVPYDKDFKIPEKTLLKIRDAIRTKL